MPKLRVIVESSGGGGGEDVTVHEEVQQTNKTPLSEGKKRLAKKLGLKPSQLAKYRAHVGSPEGELVNWAKTTKEVRV